MMQLLQNYFGSSVSTEVMELTAAALLIGFIMITASSVIGVLNRLFK